jgi:hypothetical protein
MLLSTTFVLTFFKARNDPITSPFRRKRSVSRRPKRPGEVEPLDESQLTPVRGKRMREEEMCNVWDEEEARCETKRKLQERLFSVPVVLPCRLSLFCPLLLRHCKEDHHSFV